MLRTSVFPRNSRLAEFGRPNRLIHLRGVASEENTYEGLSADRIARIMNEYAEEDQ